MFEKKNPKNPPLTTFFNSTGDYINLFTIELEEDNITVWKL